MYLRTNSYVTAKDMHAPHYGQTIATPSGNTCTPAGEAKSSLFLCLAIATPLQEALLGSIVPAFWGVSAMGE